MLTTTKLAGTSMSLASYCRPPHNSPLHQNITSSQQLIPDTEFKQTYTCSYPQRLRGGCYRCAKFGYNQCRSFVMLCEFGTEIIIGVHLEEFIFCSLCRIILEKKLRAKAHLAITIFT